MQGIELSVVQCEGSEEKDAVGDGRRREKETAWIFAKMAGVISASSSLPSIRWQTPKKVYKRNWNGRIAATGSCKPI